MSIVSEFGKAAWLGNVFQRGKDQMTVTKELGLEVLCFRTFESFANVYWIGI